MSVWMQFTSQYKKLQLYVSALESSSAKLKGCANTHMYVNMTYLLPCLYMSIYYLS